MPSALPVFSTSKWWQDLPVGRNADLSWKYWVCCHYLARVKHPQSTYNAQRKPSVYSQRTHVLKVGSTQRLGP